MPKFGEVRADGKRYWARYQSGPKAGYEYWRDPDDFAKAEARGSKERKESRARLSSDPEFKRAWNERMKNYIREDYRRGMLNRARQAAKRGVPCNLESIEDIPYVTRCPVFGVELVVGTKQHNFSPSLDKIRPELGYVKGNIIVVSFLANRIKSDATPEQIMAVAKFYKKLCAKLVSVPAK